MRLLIALLVTAMMAASCGPQATSAGKDSAPAGGGISGSTGSDGSVVYSVPPGSQAPSPTRGKATKVVPRPGPGATPVLPIRVRAGTADGVAYADVSWWGGVQSCYPLRPVKIIRDGDTIRLKLAEGMGGGDVCIDIALLKTTRVSLGKLAPGTYTVIAGPKKTHLTIS
jgi:hypothetical protein